MLQRKGTGRLEEPVSRRLAGFRDHQRFVDQRAHVIEHRPFIELPVSSHRLRQLHSEAAREYAQPPEDDPFLIVEQAMAPLQRGAQGLMAAKRSACTSGEQLEARVEFVPHSPQTQRGYARSRQLDRQRQSVEPPADVDRQLRVLFVQRETRIHRPHARLEQRHRPELACAACLRFRRHSERHDAKLLLFRHVQRFLTGRQQRDLRCRSQNNFDQRTTASSRCSQLSSTSRRCPRHKAGDQLFECRALSNDLEVERAGDSVRQQRGLGQAGEFDHPHTVRPLLDRGVRGCLRHAALADAARADDRHEPVLGHQRAQGPQIIVTPVQNRKFDRQIGTTRCRRTRL